MTDPVKRKLSAKQILADIRSGMDAPALKHEHSLSDRSFEYVLKQLTAAGLLTQDEMRRLEPQSGSSKPSQESAREPQWRCPACNAPQAAEVAECPVCGVVVAKFVAHQGQAPDVSSISPQFTRDAASFGGSGWTPVILSIVVLALIGIAVMVWSTHRASEKSKIAALDMTTQPAQEDDSEADQPQERTSGSENLSPDFSEVKIEDEPGRIEPPPPIVALPREPPAQQVEPPRETPTPAPQTPAYVTGVLRQFGSGDFKKEVVEASKTYPVLFLFYSDT